MTRTSTEKAKAHARIAHYCTCGRIVRGNGAKYQHAQKHRRHEGAIPHTYITREHFMARQRADTTAQAEAEG